jgi:hypothetical protein
MKNRLEGQFAATQPMNRRSFTPEEAERSLVFIRKVVGDVLQEYRRLLDLQEVTDTAQRDGRDSDGDQARRSMIAAVERIQKYVEELDMVGVELRDWTTGVVDFPCNAGGRKVSLCWKYGERRINSWYEEGGDLDDRQPIETLPAGLTV